jgi:hypothetical protein
MSGIDRVLTASQAADKMGISLDALYQRLSRAAKKGDPTPFTRVPSRGRPELRVLMSGLARWADLDTARPTS